MQNPFIFFVAFMTSIDHAHQHVFSSLNRSIRSAGRLSEIVIESIEDDFSNPAFVPSVMLLSALCAGLFVMVVILSVVLVTRVWVNRETARGYEALVSSGADYRHSLFNRPNGQVQHAFTYINAGETGNCACGSKANRTAVRHPLSGRVPSSPDHFNVFMGTDGTFGEASLMNSGIVKTASEGSLPTNSTGLSHQNFNSSAALSESDSAIRQLQDHSKTPDVTMPHHKALPTFPEDATNKIPSLDTLHRYRTESIGAPALSTFKALIPPQSSRLKVIPSDHSSTIPSLDLNVSIHKPEVSSGVPNATQDSHGVALVEKIPSNTFGDTLQKGVTLFSPGTSPHDKSPAELAYEVSLSKSRVMLPQVDHSSLYTHMVHKNIIDDDKAAEAVIETSAHEMDVKKHVAFFENINAEQESKLTPSQSSQLTTQAPTQLHIMPIDSTAKVDSPNLVGGPVVAYTEIFPLKASVDPGKELNKEVDKDMNPPQGNILLKEHLPLKPAVDQKNEDANASGFQNAIDLTKPDFEAFNSEIMKKVLDEIASEAPVQTSTHHQAVAGSLNALDKDKDLGVKQKDENGSNLMQNIPMKAEMHNEQKGGKTDVVEGPIPFKESMGKEMSPAIEPVYDKSVQDFSAKPVKPILTEPTSIVSKETVVDTDKSVKVDSILNAKQVAPAESQKELNVGKSAEETGLWDELLKVANISDEAPEIQENVVDELKADTGKYIRPFGFPSRTSGRTSPTGRPTKTGGPKHSSKSGTKPSTPQKETPLFTGMEATPEHSSKVTSATITPKAKPSVDGKLSAKKSQGSLPTTASDLNVAKGSAAVKEPVLDVEANKLNLKKLDTKRKSDIDETLKVDNSSALVDVPQNVVDVDNKKNSKRNSKDIQKEIDDQLAALIKSGVNSPEKVSPVRRLSTKPSDELLNVAPDKHSLMSTQTEAKKPQTSLKKPSVGGNSIFDEISKHMATVEFETQNATTGKFDNLYSKKLSDDKKNPPESIDKPTDKPMEIVAIETKPLEIVTKKPDKAEHFFDLHVPKKKDSFQDNEKLNTDNVLGSLNISVNVETDNEFHMMSETLVDQVEPESDTKAAPGKNALNSFSEESDIYRPKGYATSLSETFSHISVVPQDTYSMSKDGLFITKDAKSVDNSVSSFANQRTIVPDDRKQIVVSPAQMRALAAFPATKIGENKKLDDTPKTEGKTTTTTLNNQRKKSDGQSEATTAGISNTLRTLPEEAVEPWKEFPVATTTGEHTSSHPVGILKTNDETSRSINSTEHGALKSALHKQRKSAPSTSASPTSGATKTSSKHEIPDKHRSQNRAIRPTTATCLRKHRHRHCCTNNDHQNI